MLDWTDPILRLTAATVIGAAIGLDRDLRGKPAGVRTMGVVALGSALIVLASQYPAGIPDPAAASRVMQGIITGIGFLGAGVILRDSSGGKVRGLTTAAVIWLTACIGAACGSGAWTVVASAAVLVALLLAFGKPLERAFESSPTDEDYD
ncbi:MAG: MgtC/SapB family protein [Rhodomicrobium sp.]|nr:MgtC/SapB family protein [Rhodomicrobium sp.]